MHLIPFTPHAANPHTLDPINPPQDDTTPGGDAAAEPRSHHLPCGAVNPHVANPRTLAPQDDTTPGGGVTLLLSRAPSTSPVALPGSDVATSPSSLLVTRAEVEAIARQAVSLCDWAHS